MGIYQREAQGRKIRTFINVGSAVANLGEGMKPLPTGRISRRPEQLPEPSVIRAMAEKGVAIINLTDVALLAYRYRFPVAPIPLPALAKGRLFVERKYPVGLALAFAVVIVVLLFFVIEYDLDYYRRRLFGQVPVASEPTKK